MRLDLGELCFLFEVNCLRMTHLFGALVVDFSLPLVLVTGASGIVFFFFFHFFQTKCFCMFPLRVTYSFLCSIYLSIFLDTVATIRYIGMHSDTIGTTTY